MAGVRADRDAAVIVGARSGRSRGVAALRPYHAPTRGRRGAWATHHVAPTCWGVPVYGARDVYSLAPFAMPPAGSPAPCPTLPP